VREREREKAVIKGEGREENEKEKPQPWVWVQPTENLWERSSVGTRPHLLERGLCFRRDNTVGKRKKTILTAQEVLKSGAKGQTADRAHPVVNN